MNRKSIFLFLVLLASAGTELLAQKVANINLSDLLLVLPERKKAETDIQEYAKTLDNQMRTMNAEYEAKIQDYQSKEAVMTDPVKLDKQKEIADLEDRIKNFQSTAQESLQKKQTELLEPMVDKCKKAIAEVAKEGGYKYVLDSSQGSILYSEPADDIMPQVKKKLNITTTAETPKDVKAPEKK